MNEENQTTVSDESVEDESVTKVVETTTPDSGDTLQVDDPELEVMVTSPIDFRESTIFSTEKGEIHVIHEITLGDIIVSTSLVAILIFMLLSRIIRR